MNLEEYHRLGGNVSNLDLENTTITYHDISEQHKKGKIIKVEDIGERNSFGDPLFNVHYNNSLPRLFHYVGRWISTQVELQLTDKFTRLTDEA